MATEQLEETILHEIERRLTDQHLRTEMSVKELFDALKLVQRGSADGDDEAPENLSDMDLIASILEFLGPLQIDARRLAELCDQAVKKQEGRDVATVETPDG